MGDTSPYGAAIWPTSGGVKVGVLGIFGIRKKKLRGPGRTAAERKALAEARLMTEDYRFLQEMREQDPAAYRELMKDRISKRFGVGGDAKDPVQVTLKTLKALREIQDPQESSTTAIVREIAPALGPILQAFVQASAQASAQRAPAVQQVATPPPPPVPPPAPDAAQIEPPPQDVPMSDASKFLVGVLKDMTPEQAAAWFVSQQHEGIQQIVQQLCQTPDEQLPAFLAHHQTATPALAGFVVWLRQRPDWFVATVHAIRQQVGQQPPGI